MKPKKSAPIPPEYEPKHRLAGAIILVVAAVLVVPIILPERAIESRLESHAPSASDAAAKPIAIVVPLSPAESSAEPASKPALKPAQSTKSTKSNESAQPTAAATPNPPKPPKPPKTPPTAASGWEVRVGTYFSSKADTDQVIADLAANGFAVQRTAVQSSLGDDGVRLWLGPYAERDTADAVAAQLIAITRERGYVKKHAP